MVNILTALDSTVIAILLNVLLSKLLGKFANDEEIKPPNGAAALPLKSQFMHMMVHHDQVLFMSSFIVGLVVFLATILSQLLRPLSRLM